MLRHFLRLGFVCASAIGLFACQNLNYQATVSPKPQHQITADIPHEAMWLESKLENNYGEMTIANAITGSPKELTYGWYKLTSLEEFIKLTNESAALQQKETGCQYEMAPIKKSNDLLVYKEKLSLCKHKQGNYETYGKAFVTTDGIYTISFSAQQKTSEADNLSAYQQAILDSVLLPIENIGENQSVFWPKSNADTPS